MGLLHCGSPCFIMRYRDMEMIVAVIILSAMGLLVGFSLAWYTLKLRCLNYEGRAEGIVTNTEDTQYKDPGTKEKKLRRSVTAEYVVESITYKARTSFEANELYESSQVTILYDESCPRRYIFEHEIADVKKAKKRWLVAPGFAIVMAALALWFLIPPLFGFTGQQKNTFDDVTDIAFVLLLLLLGILELRKRYKSGKPTKKYIVRLILAALLAAMFVIVCFFPMIIFR